MLSRSDPLKREQLLRQARYFGKVKSKFQLYLAATVANLTLVLGNIGLSGSTGDGAAGHRVVLNDVHTVVANAAANFSAARLGQLWSLFFLTSALPPKSFYHNQGFPARFLGIAMQLIWVEAATIVLPVVGGLFFVWLLVIGAMLATGRVERHFVVRYGESAT